MVEQDSIEICITARQRLLGLINADVFRAVMRDVLSHEVAPVLSVPPLRTLSGSRDHQSGLAKTCKANSTGNIVIMNSLQRILVFGTKNICMALDSWACLQGVFRLWGHAEVV